MTLALPAEGGCTCGQVRYRLTGEPVFLTICHCTECQRQSGSAFGMSMRMRREDVTVTRGELKSWTRIADNGNAVGLAFCANCGTRIWHEPAEPGFVHIKPGTLDDTSQLRPRYQSYTVRQHDWVKLDGIEMSFETMPAKRGQV
ncbi:MAG TPA: GFA family protein [Hyphomonadaceae bacterium]|nr:GFA family protein [Hyphomonadaceae bacterium]